MYNKYTYSLGSVLFHSLAIQYVVLFSYLYFYKYKYAVSLMAAPVHDCAAVPLQSPGMIVVLVCTIVLYDL